MHLLVDSKPLLIYTIFCLFFIDRSFQKSFSFTEIRRSPSRIKKKPKKKNWKSNDFRQNMISKLLVDYSRNLTSFWERYSLIHTFFFQQKRRDGKIRSGTEYNQCWYWRLDIQECKDKSNFPIFFFSISKLVQKVITSSKYPKAVEKDERSSLLFCFCSLENYRSKWTFELTSQILHLSIS